MIALIIDLVCVVALVGIILYVALSDVGVKAFGLIHIVLLLELLVAITDIFRLIVY